MNYQGIIFILMAIFTIICTIKKPTFFWEHRKAKLLRKILGNKLTSVFYMLIGIFLFGVGMISLFAG